MFRKVMVSLFTAMVLVLSLPYAAPAGQKHAGYGRAISDLRLARALLQRTNDSRAINGSQDEVSLAISNIDGAIAEMSKEFVADGKKTQEISRVDARMPWAERLSRTYSLLDKAKQDSKEKDSGGDSGLQARVLDHIDQAHTRIRVAIETINFDYDARNMKTRDD